MRFTSWWGRTVTLAATVVLMGTSAPAYQFSSHASADTRAAVAAGRIPAHGFPAIVDVHWSTTKIRPNTAMEALIRTTPNVTTVSGRLHGYAMPFVQTAPGEFHIKYTIPLLPPFLLGRWHIDLVAETADGVEVSQTSDLSYSYF